MCLVSFLPLSSSCLVLADKPMTCARFLRLRLVLRGGGYFRHACLSVSLSLPLYLFLCLSLFLYLPASLFLPLSLSLPPSRPRSLSLSPVYGYFVFFRLLVGTDAFMFSSTAPCLLINRIFTSNRTQRIYCLCRMRQTDFGVS